MQIPWPLKDHGELSVFRSYAFDGAIEEIGRRTVVEKNHENIVFLPVIRRHMQRARRVGGKLIPSYRLAADGLVDTTAESESASDERCYTAVLESIIRALTSFPSTQACACWRIPRSRT